MGIKSTTTDIVFTYSNAGHTRIFPDIDSINNLHISIWVFLEDAIPFILWNYEGSGNAIRIEHNGTNWILLVGGTTKIISTITLATWINITYIKTGDNHKIYYKVNAGSRSLVVNNDISVIFAFGLFTLKASKNNAICNLKVIASAADVSHSDEWMVFVGTATSVIWTTTLRRPGDMFAFTGYQPFLWVSAHEWTTTPDWTTVSYKADPTDLIPKICYAWLIPIGGVPSVHFESDPISVPPTTIAETSDGFFMVEDRKAVPLDAFIRTIRYHGFLFNTETSGAVISINTWTAFKYEDGVYHDEVQNASRDAIGTEGATPYTYLDFPGIGNRPLNMTNVYLWQYGVHWFYDRSNTSGGPSVPSAHSHVTECALSVEYTGDFGVDSGPGGGPIEPPVEPPGPVGTGIYFINPTKAERHDSYYVSEERKIPNPTIKTAILGE